MKTDIGQKISVCLLAYNHVDVIESTLASILDQTVTGYEVIVSDDCSTDGTWEKILELAAADPRIVPVRTTHNIGMPGNANFAVAKSSRTYIALLHHDDLCRRDLLEKWAGVLDRTADAAFVFNPYGVFESAHICEEPMPGECIAGQWLLERFLFARWGCVVRGTAMIRRKAWEQVGGMREQFDLLADVDMWMRLARRWPVGYVPEPLITLRHHRPSNYPEIYKGTASTFWRRQRFLYEIHISNRLDYLDFYALSGRLRWWGFRVKLSFETAKWLIYAIVRKRAEMIATSHECETQCDLWPLRLFRDILQRAFSPSRVLPS